MISNPFGAPPSNNDTSHGSGGLLFEQPPGQEDSDNIFVSDDPQHSGIQMTNDSDSANMFMADPPASNAPLSSHSLPSQQSSRPPAMQPPRRTVPQQAQPRRP